MNKHRHYRIIFTALLVLLGMLLSVISVSAVEYSSENMDSIMNDWNKTKYSNSNSTSNKYHNASQCAAFVRYAFYNLYGHDDRTGDTDNNIVYTFECKTISETLAYLKQNAAPGDAFRISAKKNPSSNTHIMLLSDIDRNNKLAIYHSNLGEKNKAKFANERPLKSILTTTMNSVVKIDKDKNTLTMSVTLEIIHSKNNKCTSQDLAVNQYVNVTYDANGGICSATTRNFNKTKTFGSHPLPLRPGYVFSGWYTHASGGQKVDSKALVNGQRTLYAQWVKCTHASFNLTHPLLSKDIKFYEGGICQICGAEYPYEVTYQKAQIYKVTNSKGAPCRTRPYSKNSETVNTMKKDTIVSVVGQTHNMEGNLWYLLSDGTWVYSENVAKSSASNVYYVAKTDGFLILSKTADAKNEIDRMNEGAVVTVNKSKNKGSWYYVTYNGKSGYAYKSYLTKTAPEIHIATSSMQTVMRAKANTTSSIRTKISAGSYYVVYPNRTANSSKYYLAFSNGIAGYIKRSDAALID